MFLKKKNEYLAEVLLGIVFLGLVMNLASSELQDILKVKFSEWFPGIEYAYSIFLWSAVVVTIVSYVYIKWYQAKDKTKILQQSQEDRTALLDSLEKRYIRRLKKKMDNDIKLIMELQLQYTDEGTEQSFIEENFIEEYKLESAGDFDSLYKNYEDKIYRLLIIGDPGSGKSTLLLRFASKLLSNAKASNVYPIPIILNLSSWRNEYKSFINWVEQSLVHYGGEFGTSKENAKLLANSNNLILLLDGLDEVPQDHRASCLQQLKIYLNVLNQRKETNYPELIITCRREEYKQVLANAPVQASINVESISEEDLELQLQNIIKHNNIRSNAAYKLKEIFKKNPEVKALLSTAFYLHIALSLVGEGYKLDQINTQEALLKLYVNKEKKKVSQEYSDKTITSTLCWISKIMTDSKKGITFELLDMQPKSLKHKYTYLLLIVLLQGSFFSGFTIAIWRLLFNNSISIYFAFSLSAAIALIGNIDLKMDEKESVSVNLKHFSFEELFFNILITIIAAITISILFLVNAYLFRYDIHFNMAIGPALYLVFLMFTSLFIEEKKIPVITDPYKRMTLDSIFSFVHYSICMISALFIQQFFVDVFSYRDIFIYSILFGIGCSILTTPIMQYIAVQTVLTLDKTTPFNLVKCLNAVSDNTGLLERDGGQWRFRHDLIQKEFYRR